MTVNKLIWELQKLQKEMGDHEVIVSADAEGNHYSPVVDVAGGYYCENVKEYWIDSVFSDSHSFKDNGYETKAEWEADKARMDRVVVIWPVN